VAHEASEEREDAENDLEIGEDENCENMESVRAVVVRRCRLGSTGDKQRG